MNRTVFLPKSILGLAAACLLIACTGGGDGGGAGGGDGNGDGSSPSLTGIFHDSPTNGLAYNCLPSGNSGTTYNGGKFDHEQDDTCSFSLGAIQLGSVNLYWTTEEGVIISPVDLVSGGSPSDPTVINIVQLLTAADDDGDLTNGINILPEVAAAANSAGSIDISSASFDSDVASVIADMNAAGSHTASLTSEADAQNHIETSALCIYSGLYNGTWSASQNSGGYWGLIIYPSGLVQAIGIDDTPDSDGFTGAGSFEGSMNPSTGTFSGSGTYNLIDQYGIIIPSDNNVVSATGNVSNPISISGTMSPSGTFSGTKFAHDTSAAYRYVGRYRGSDADGVFAIDIYADNSVGGKSYNFKTKEFYYLNGTVDETGNLSISAVTGVRGVTVTGSANLDLNAGTMTNGVWSGGGASGTVTGSGCKLNTPFFQ